MAPAETESTLVLSHTARRRGFEAAMRRHHLEPDVIETWYSEEGGYRAALQAFDRVEPPTAIFAGADIAAFGVLRAAEEQGLRVPEDLTVVGYDNIYMATIGRVSLTTVDQSGHLTGRFVLRLRGGGERTGFTAQVERAVRPGHIGDRPVDRGEDAHPVEDQRDRLFHPRRPAHHFLF